MIRGQTFTLAQMLAADLPDSPWLGFNSPKAGDTLLTVVQTSHVTQEQMLALPRWAETEWQYAYTTSEMIPVFQAVDDQLIEDLCDFCLSDDLNTSMVFPKGSNWSDSNCEKCGTMMEPYYSSTHAICPACGAK